MANSIPPKPWLHHTNHSASSLTELGMEITIPPNNQQSRPHSLAHSHLSDKALPALPYNTTNQERNEIPSSTPLRMKTSPQRETEKRPMALVLDSRQTHSASDLSNAKLPPPPPTPMSKSSRKVLQLTGFNPNYEKTFRDELHHFNEIESISSVGSVYSQDTESAFKARASSSAHSLTYATPLSPPRPVTNPNLFLQSKVYDSSGKSSIKSSHKPNDSQASSVRDSREQTQADRIYGGESSHSNTVNTYEDLVANERLRFEAMGDEVWGQNIGHFKDHRSHFEQPMQEVELVPRPLTIRTRPQPLIELERPVSHFSDNSSDENSPSIFKSARESFAMGIRELSSPTKSSSSSRMPPPPKPKRKRDFSSGAHPLKSPFPFRKSSEPSFPGTGLSSPITTGSELRRRLSGAMKRISGTGNNSTNKETIVPNESRRASGPDTPILSKTGFLSRLHDSADVIQKNVHFQEVVTKAKNTVKVKSVAERRRDNLRKNITVIGPSDQTPDGKVAEWL